MTCDPDPILGAAGGASILVLADGDGAKLVEPTTPSSSGST